jgi:murein DD-endopeptidase MepM/ murein hydrolase activator NlpD
MKWTEQNTWLGAALATIGLAWLTSRSRSGILPPVQGRVSSGYGMRTHPQTGKFTFHNGIDYAVPINTLVQCPADGVVTSQYSNETGGKQMIIKHDNGYTTGYAHLNSFIALPNARVKQGQGIARSGNTGKSTGPHLHFTVRDRIGEYVDPRSVLG